MSQILADGTATYVYGAGSDRLLARTTTARTWHLADALGSLRATLDGTGLPRISVNHYDNEAYEPQRLLQRVQRMRRDRARVTYLYTPCARFGLPRIASPHHDDGARAILPVRATTKERGMAVRWDIVTFDRDQQLVLVVEVKNKRDADPFWAARLRTNILAHGSLPNAPYFLLAVPNRFYLWAHTDHQDELAPPTYTIDAASLLQPYFDQAGISPDHVSSQSLEFIVASWLNELLHTTPDVIAASHPWLIESGLYAAMVAGHVASEVVV